MYSFLNSHSALFAALETFKFVSRTMPLPNDRHENDAEHSWNLAMLALILAPKFPELDLSKCLQYALIHDLGELYAGDTYIYDQAWLADKAKKEAESMEKLFALMPHDTHEQFEKLWHDYETRANLESQFIYELDKIHPIILIVSLETNAWLDYEITKERILETKLAKLSDRFGFREMLVGYIEEADRKGLLHKPD